MTRVVSPLKMSIGISITGRQPDEKHILCKKADNVLAYLNIDLVEYRKALREFRPARSTEPTGPTLQERFEGIQNHLPAVSCYIKMHAGQTNLPKTGEDGKVWLQGYRREIRGLKQEMVKLRQDVILTAMVMLTKFIAEVQKSTTLFLAHYNLALSLALTQMRDDLDDNDVNWLYLWKPLLEARLVSLHDRALFPDVPSLGETGLVQRLAALARSQVKTWDEKHGVKAVLTRQVLLEMAFKTEDNYNKGVYAFY